MNFSLPRPDCPLCPRLCVFREQNQQDYPTFFNAPVPSFGDINAEFLVVGLAPGLQGANATGRPFTGDYAGDILYASLLKNDFATGSYTSPRGAAISGVYKDNLTLKNCRITNAVRCVPPENKPEPSEIKQCNNFLKNEIAAMPRLKIILSLGLVSHNAALMAFGLKASYAKFAHGAVHSLVPPPAGGRLGGGHVETLTVQRPLPNSPPNGEGIRLLNSYHCSRYNINTGRLTQAMFDEVIKQVRDLI